MTGTEDPSLAINELFDIDSFFKPKKFNGHSIFLPSDDDILHLLKSHLEGNKYAMQWLSRRHNYFPVWKSFAEFNEYFGDLNQEYLKKGKKLDRQIHTITKEFVDKHGLGKDKFIIQKIDIDISNILPNQVNVFINEKVVCYTNLYLPGKTQTRDFMILVYLANELKDWKMDYIEQIKKIMSH